MYAMLRGDSVNRLDRERIVSPALSSRLYRRLPNATLYHDETASPLAPRPAAHDAKPGEVHASPTRVRRRAEIEIAPAPTWGTPQRSTVTWEMIEG